MRHKRLKLSAILLLSLGMTGLQAQESLNTIGGDASGSGGSVNFSVGQVMYKANNGANGSVAEGVQQPYEVSEVTAIEEAKEINLSITAFPNPTADYLILKIDAMDIADLSYQLYDGSGKILQDEKITGNQTKIFLTNFFPAVYFVRIVQDQRDVKTFKVIKK